MSRQIDITKPLSDEDRQYLVDRAEYGKLEQNRQIVEGGAVADASALSASDGSRLEGAFDPAREPGGDGFRGAGIDLNMGRRVDLPPHLAGGAEDGEPPLPEGLDDDGEDGGDAGDAGEDADPDGNDSDGGSEPGDYSEMTVDELKDELGKRELSRSGNKSELVARLREDDAS